VDIVAESNSITVSVSQERHNIFELMGQSSSIQRLYRQLQQVASTNFTVIIQGETGTGKELVARLIHEHSKRADNPFVPVDCGALPDSIIESELFGYVKGAFTGADSRKVGYFEMAKGGSLFLDEIGNMSPSVQMKLLRTLQEQRILPLGGNNSLAIDVRVIVASNAILEEEVLAGRFRADLFHRLNEFKIDLPPLRERREDILYLAERFRCETNIELDKDTKRFSAEAKTHLLNCDWTGNVRELRNAVRRAVLLANHVIEVGHLRHIITPTSLTAVPSFASLDLASSENSQSHSMHDLIDKLTSQLEKALLQHALKVCSGNKSQAARLLNIGYKTFYRKLKKHQIE
jgi:transcriptional regulator with GAF, ATPase, and Fis domain